MQQIHRFCQSGVYMALDVNSGVVHEVDHITWDILEFYKRIPNADIIAKLSNKYDVNELKEAINELDELVSDGLLYTDDSEYEFIINAPPKGAVIKSMCMHLSHDCNMRCRYCFASTGNFGGQRVLMNYETGKAALDFLIERSGSRKHLEVDFFGGEPLMNFDVMKELVAYGRELEKGSGKYIRFTLTTNGLALTEEKIKYINDNMDNIVLSIDGRPSVNDNMRKTVTNKGTHDILVPKFKELINNRHRGDYYVRGTFTKENLDFAEDVMYLVDLGFDQVSVEPVVAKDQPYGLGEEDLPRIFEQYDKLVEEYIERERNGKPFNFFHFMIDLEQGPCVAKRVLGCGAGSEYIAVTPEGDIYPCHQFVGNKDFVMGNVVRNELDTEKQALFSNCNVFTKDECRQCWARFYCSGGCAANAYLFNGRIDEPYHLYCAMEKKRIECALAIKAILGA